MAESSKSHDNANRARLLNLLLKRNSGESDNSGAIVPRNPESRIPLSYAQERLWFLEQLTPDSAAYIFCNIVHLTGPIEVPALLKAYQMLIDRHEIFRTRFEAVDGSPEQIVVDGLQLDIPQVDLSDIPESEARERLKEIASNEASIPFDLTRAPMLRITIVKMSDTRFEVLQTMHHIVYDGWSLAVLFRELKELYESQVAGDSSSLAALEIQYGDYSLWQRQLDNSGEFARQLETWTETLSGAPAVLDVPSDHPRPPVQSYSGALHRLHLNKALTDSLNELAQRSDCTMFIILLTAFKILLHRYTQQADILVGTPLAGRNQQQTEQLIGFFINSLVLRTSLTGDPSVAELLERVKRTCSSAFANQDIPFERIVEELSPKRDLSHNPVFQVMFAFQNTPPPVNRFGTATLSLEEVDNETSLFDITLNLHEESNGIFGYIEYCRDLFDAERIARMAEHFQFLLKSMVENSNKPVTALEILSTRERELILHEWNATQADYPEKMCIHELIEQQLKHNGEASAAYFKGETITYAELDRRANQLAHALLSSGVKPNEFVGLCLDRSFEMLIGIVGILKAGAAYLPLDPKYPEDRLQFMLADCGSKLVLSRSNFLKVLPQDIAKTILFDQDESMLSDQPGTSPSIDLDNDSLAYTIYTSGSTGKPKGVMVSHNNLVHSTSARLSYYPDSVDAFLLLSSYSFDSSVAGIYWTLCNGGMLVLPPQDDEQDVLAIGKLLEETRTSHLLALPSLYGLILQLCPSAQLSSLTVAIVAGEACSPELVQQSHSVLPGTKLFNEYGPTEGTVWCTVYEAVDSANQATVPIGRPIDNMQAYILDDAGNPAPIGIPGELYIGGSGLTRGYINRPELTSEKFIEKTFNGDGRCRLYRTGDLARYRSDGNIEFLGRIDDQVKIRGFRIELGEIESRLIEHQAVHSAAVNPVRDKTGTTRLAAYCVLLDGKTAEIVDLRNHIKEQLPDYMVPAGFVILDELPLTPNGKVDKQALPTPDIGKGIARGTPSVEPSSENERILVAIWREVLGIEELGVEDNFFELGGDSILSIQIIARARQAGLILKPRQVFEYQTIVELATQAIRSDQQIVSEQGAVVGNLPLTPIQIWFFQHRFGHPDHWNQPAVLRIEQDLNQDAFETAWGQLLMHHDVLRSTFSHQDDTWQASIVNSCNTPILQQVDASNLSDFEQQELFDSIVVEKQAQLKLSRPPAINFTCIDYGQGLHKEIVIVTHHLLVDGISWRILVEDLNTLYLQNISNSAKQLPQKSSSYRSWAEALVEYASDPELISEVSYWLAQASSDQLPVTAAIQSDKESDARTVTAKLDKSGTEKLLQDCHGAYYTQINDLLLTALLRTIGEWTGQNRLHLTLEGHGREDILEQQDISRTVGWFTTLFPVLLAGAGDDLGNDIKTIKEQLRAIPNRGIGYSVLRYLGSSDIRKKLAAGDEPALLFNYLGKFDSAADKTAILSWVHRPTPGDHAPDCERDHWLEFNAIVFDDELIIDLSYNPGRHSPEIAGILVNNFIRNLHEIIDHCMSPQAGGHTPSDFVLAEIDQLTLDTHPHLSKPGIQDIYPLSPMQEGILFHSIDNAESGNYIEQYLCEFEGTLVADIFENAWHRLIQRHDILRTSFLWQDLDTPLQVVHADARPHWTYEDWRSFGPEECQARLAEYLAKDRVKGFSVAEVPLMRMALFQTADDSHMLVWTFHHLLMDGWCLDLVLREVFSHYNRSQGLESEPLLTPQPYKNFIAWLGNQDLAAAKTYWTGLLQGFDTPNQVQLPPPKDPGRESTAKVLYELPVPLSEEFAALAKRHHLTPNTLVQAAWALVLGCYSNSRDVVFGFTVSGRTPEVTGIEQMVGLFINTLPIRVKTDTDVTCLELLKAIQSQQTETSEYEYTPLARIQSWSEVHGGDALFESIVVYENFPDETPGSPELRIKSQDAVEQTNYPLTIMASLRSRLQLGVSYDPRRFDREAMQRLLEHMQVVLQAFVDSLEVSCSEVNILSEAEKNLLLHQWNCTERPLPDQRCVHQMIDQLAQSQPHRLAVKDQFQELSYLDLNRRAGGLATIIRQDRFVPGTCAGVLLNRSAKLPVALLAIMKAGGAYLPMDIAYPEDRILYMLEDSAAGVLITESTLLDQCREFSGKIIVLDEVWDQLASHDESGNFPPEAAFNDLAYLIYTSGSTGLPKGVEVTHQGLRNLVNWHNISYQITSQDRASLLAGLAFDASVWETWPYLSVGASLHIPDDEIRLSPAETLRWMYKNEISVSFVPTPLAEIMLLEDIPADLQLRYLLTGGDKLHSPPRQQLPFELVNHYGPTENSVVATAGKIDVDATPGATPCIGRPIDNTKAYVLDQNHKPVPVGVPGELYISGIGLARGYRNLPEITAEAFLDNPFINSPYDRMYKTGDLVRYTAEGNLDFLGRLDHQVKIRGYRIELGEIESQLTLLDYVRDTLVVVYEEQPGDRKLVAYLVCREHSPELNTIKEHLRQKLPLYMVPTYFVFLEAFPLTPNGKIDRRSLPPPVPATEDINNEHAGATNQTEEMLLEIWRQVLGVEQLGIHTNFFELGGDSIISIQIISRARQHDLVLTTKQIFENPTISQLALAATPLQTENLVIEQVTEDPFILTPIQDWYFQRNLDEPQHWNQAYLFTLLETSDSGSLQKAFEALVRHHDSLRLAFVVNKNRDWEQHYTPAGNMELSVMDLSDLEKDAQNHSIKQISSEVQTRNQLESGSIVQVVLFELGSKRLQRLLIVIHHLAVDGISWRILIEDLQLALDQIRMGDEPKLPAKTASFQRWSSHLQAHKESAGSDLGFWREQLAGNLQIPVDRWRPKPNTVASSEVIARKLSEENTTRLLQQASRAYNTQIDDLLLTALARALSVWTGQYRHYIHLESHGREPYDSDFDLSRTVGWFTSLFPVMLECSPGSDLPASIVKTKEKLHKVPKRGVSYGILRYLADDETQRYLAENDNAQILFNYLGQFDQSFESGGLLKVAAESSGASESQHNIRSHALEINCLVSGGQLEVAWSYSRNLHRSGTVQKLAESFVNELENLILHCLDGQSGFPTPSDFPLAYVRQESLDYLRHRFEARIHDIYPLAPIQQGMLYHALTDPESAVSFEQYSLSLAGRVDPDKIRQAWQFVVDRHDALKTAFHWEQLDVPLQFVLEQIELPWKYIDLRDLGKEEASSQVEEYRNSDKQQGFDLEKPPLLRVALFHIEDDSAEMVWSFHHIILDGWSMSLVLKQFLSACAKIENLAIKPRTRSYRDYVAWLGDQNADLERGYWSSYLTGFDRPTLILDALLQSEVPKGPGNAAASLLIDREISSQITQLARDHGITANTLVQAAWAVLISRYCETDDVIFGSTVSGRPGDIAGIEEIVGNFINIVPVRVKLGMETTILEMLLELQKQQLSVRQFEFTPLGDIHSLSPLPRNSPFFDSLLVFENYPLEQQKPDPEELQIVDSRLDEMTNFPLNLIVFPGSRMRLEMTFQLEALCNSTIERLLSQLAATISHMVENLDLPVTDISIQDAEKGGQVMEMPMQGRGAFNLFPLPLSPQAIAIKMIDGEVSYADLQSNLISRMQWFRERQIGAGDSVVLESVEATDFFLTALSCMTLGAQVIPLSAQAPEKLSSQVQSSVQPKLWIGRHGEAIEADEVQLSKISTDKPGRRHDDLKIGNHGNLLLLTELDTNRGTSTSVSYRTFVNIMLQLGEKLDIGPDTTLLLALPAWTSAALALALATITRGGSVKFGSAEESPLLAQQGQQPAGRSILAGSATSIDKHLASEAVVNMDKIVCIADRLDDELLKRWLDRGDEIWKIFVSPCTGLPASISPCHENGGALLGDPLPGFGFTVNSRGRPSITGARGQLVIQDIDGKGEQGNRITSTIPAAYLNSGEIVLLPGNVSIISDYGIRIDLDAVAAIAKTNPLVKDALAVVLPASRSGASVKTRLYCEPAQGASITTTELRDILRRELPSYAIPSELSVEATVLKANGGEFDRDSILKLIDEESRAAYFDPPRGLQEEKLAAIWKQMLDIEQVSRNDHFFDLGGNSFMSMNLLARIRSELNCEISPRLLLFGSLKQIAAACDKCEEIIEAPVTEKTSWIHRLLN